MYLFSFFFSLINRACVAGFTNISFTMANIIVGEDSYVSFSPCSQLVLLPQDPGIVNVKYRTGWFGTYSVWRFLNYGKFHNNSKTPVGFSVMGYFFVALQ